ncbi:MAG: peptidoglycan synthetase, partial [Flavobacterium sp.]|nr:peptidoglycan synthetase [Flavobacterium sp.]
TTITAMIMHILLQQKIDFDYLVGAQLDGFEYMVKTSNTAKNIIIEGDEYLTSPLDLKSKFLHYHPNIAIISGIAWDHINVFPTFENYVEQFEIFVNQITKGGILVYNEEDETVKKVAEETTNTIRRLPYQTPNYSVENGTTYLDTPEGPMPIEVFGAHNLNNLAGAKWICQNMGIDEADFYEAIASFKGASKRLEKIAEGKGKVAYKDFAHSPSKVSATTKAVKDQYPDRKLVACLELHTYSSLNAEFLKEYEGALDAADVAVVFYSPDAVKIKQLEEVTYDQIAQSFKRNDLIIYTNPTIFKDFLFSTNLDNSALLLMSSGNYGGLDFEEVKELVN